jgi:23S rRNA (adenine2503-C2)-methyltransferase
MKITLLGKSINEIEEIILPINGNTHHAKEIAKWLYKRNGLTFNSIESIPLTLRKSIELICTSGRYSPLQVIESKDGSRKYLFKNDKEHQFESVFMPGEKRNTLCISSQSGCKMGCGFCLTAKVGFKGNLSFLDILNQYYSIPEQKKVNRIVIMGMGEPFDNYYEVKKAVEVLTSQWGANFGAQNITISTVGLIKPLKTFIENPFCNLAISLNNPFIDEREKIMPIEKNNPLQTAVEIIKSNPLKKPLRVSFEYVALGKLNISEQHAKAIAKLIFGINCHLNIIPWNNHTSATFVTPSEKELKGFIDCLNNSGILTSLRISRGQDIGAACGQMAG